jgi:hypothetical protein
MRLLLTTLFLTAVAFQAHAEPQAQESAGIDRPVSQQEIDRLKRRIDEETQSSFEAIADYRTESGDVNNALDSMRWGGRLNLRSGASSLLFLQATRTSYLPIHTDFRESGTNFTAGYQGRLSDALHLQIEAGATRFSTDATTINALGLATFRMSDRTAFHVEASRSNVEESLLSAAGLRPVLGPFAGQFVGGVMENRVVFGGTSQVHDRIDVFGEGGVGSRAGSNVPSNFFKTASGGAGYSVIARAEDEPLSLLRVVYEAQYFGFEENRFGFGGASLEDRGRRVLPSRLGADGVSPSPARSQPGIGGYFSPSNFFTHMFRVEAQGQYANAFDYRVSGFFGSQYYTGTSRRSANGISGTITLHLSEVASVPVTYGIDNFGPFTQQWVYARLVYRF